MSTLLRPAQPKTTTIARLFVDGSTICIAFPEIIEKFNAFVKDLGYSWHRPHWTRKISERAGSVDDRLVELGCELIGAGYCIEIDDAFAERVRAAQYTPEQTRWITRYTSGKYTDWFCVQWSRREDFYGKAKRIRGARYSPPAVAVPATSYEEVLDFAEAHGFKLSALAQKLADEARAKFEQALIVVPVAKEIQAPAQTPTEFGISDELKDEPL